jgi:hypothetical protein
MTTPVSTAQVLERFLPDYRAAHQLSPQQAKVLTSIDCCRTPVLGGQYLVCGHCGYSQERFHSCRNRHCPQCQKLASADWLERRREDILPVPYYHLVFTLPHALNGSVQLHPVVIYSLLFKAVSTTLKQFGRDPKRLNGEVGMTLVLHTWAQNLSQHVHLHCLIPGGALGQDGDILDYVMNQPWVVFARPTSQHTDQVLIYLSRYTYLIAISDRRLVSMDEQRIFFRWKNYRAGGQQQAIFGVTSHDTRFIPLRLNGTAIIKYNAMTKSGGDGYAAHYQLVCDQTFESATFTEQNFSFFVCVG